MLIEAIVSPQGNPPIAAGDAGFNLTAQTTLRFYEFLMGSLPHLYLTGRNLYLSASVKSKASPQRNYPHEQK
jgi:hypothetical protein